MSDGFLLVASKNPIYYGMAVNACQSIKNFYPEANVTLFTHEQWVDQHADIFDNVVTDIPINARAKMWAMARTPYDRTVYLDVDSQIMSRKISKIFDELEDYDYGVVPSLEKTQTHMEIRYIDKNQTHRTVFDGSFMLYRKTPDVVKFLEMWYDEWIEQVSTPWIHDFAYERWQEFDMFTAWKILKADKDKHSSAYKPQYEHARRLKCKMMNKSWNASHMYPQDLLTSRTVIMQIDRTAYLHDQKYPDLLNRLHHIIRGKSEVSRVEK